MFQKHEAYLHSRELMLQQIQKFFRTSVRHQHTIRKEKKNKQTNKTKQKLLQHLKITGIEKSIVSSLCDRLVKKCTGDFCLF